MNISTNTAYIKSTALELGFSFCGVSAVFLEGARWRKFAEAMTDHIFGDEHRSEDLAVMHAESNADEIRRNHRAPRPGFDRRLGFCVFGFLDFLLQVKIYERAFFD